MFTAIILISAIIGAIVGIITHDELWFPSLSEYLCSAFLGTWIGLILGLIIAALTAGLPQ